MLAIKFKNIYIYKDKKEKKENKNKRNDKEKNFVDIRKGQKQ